MSPQDACLSVQLKLKTRLSNRLQIQQQLVSRSFKFDIAEIYFIFFSNVKWTFVWCEFTYNEWFKFFLNSLISSGFNLNKKISARCKFHFEFARNPSSSISSESPSVVEVVCSRSGKNKFRIGKRKWFLKYCNLLVFD